MSAVRGERVSIRPFGDRPREGDIVDVHLEAEYGRPPERVLAVDVQGHVFRVPEGDADTV